MNEQELLQELLQRYPDPRKTLYPEDRGGIATPAGAGMLNGLGARPPEPVTGTGLQTAGGKPTEDAAGGCPAVYVRLAFFRFDFFFGIIKGEQPLIRGSSASKSP